MNSLWLVIGALAAFAVAYRYYGAFLAAKVAVLNDERATPAHRLRDGVDYHPTNKLVLFGHHFAAIAGPGPLVGPVLAAQWGYLPGYVWIIIGACLAGAVHDFVVLWASVREDGLSLPKIAQKSIGGFSGLTASLATLFIVIVTLASVAIVVVNALSESSWGVFTIVVTIIAALITGAWMYRIRPGKVGEASAIGVAIVLIGVVLGRPFADSAFGPMLLFSKPALSLILPSYALIASILPVWVLMCPRDYLSSYMKIGVMVVLGVGIFLAHPVLKMPATTPFVSGNGPVITGHLWPFLCITIMCGAISGFHALISSGTTPKMIYRERDILPIGYGAMLVEGFIAVTALVAACALGPGDYFAINVSQDTPAQQAAYAQVVETARVEHGWDLTPTELPELEEGTGTKLAGRTGGAVTLAVGMAKVFASFPGMRELMSYWYHFVIMFEALFILTLLETGTRVARFVFQEAASYFHPKATLGGKPNWGMNVLMSVVVCFAWGYLLYTGNINTLWRMLGIVNQLLAAIALAVGTTYILMHSAKRRYALCTGVPFAFVIVTTVTASWLSIQGWWAKIPAAAPAEAFSLRLMCILASIMLVLTIAIVADAVRRWVQILSRPAGAPEGERELETAGRA
ncbi:MAG TPA: carbon starvation protein A [Armatimonadota bacterium]|nr:carbon starvation protein A [Armatimonadota bacterium]HOM82611.1 carbon starvation protein A [Armatimonadota bacterium]HPO74059.1 carbon starvation protein A [Armatimonadota bacterium]HPT99065.1 carbon starvation protein A [Armatimonadota bacterium]